MNKRMKRKLCSLITLCAMCVTILPGTAWADGAQTPQTTTPSTGKIVQVGGYDVYVPTTADEPTGVSADTPVTEITEQYFEDTQDILDAGWYIVKTSFTGGVRITVRGDVHLILAKGATLTENAGITVQDDDHNPATPSTNTLTIWEQAEGTGGTLIASNSNNSAAIGGLNDGGEGQFIIFHQFVNSSAF